MSLRRLAGPVCALLALLVLPASAHAQSKERKAARAGLTAYNEGEFGVALRKFEEAAAGGEKLQPQERLLIFKYMGYCEVAFGRVDAAKAHFRSALEIDPAMKLDAAIVSPKILEVFGEVQRERIAAATPRPTATPVVAATPKATPTPVAAVTTPTPRPAATPVAGRTPGGMSKGKAAAFSALAPGLGQFKSGRTITGGAFAGIAATSLIGAVYLHSQAATAESYIAKAGPEDKKRMHTQAKGLASQRDMMIGVLALTWAGSVTEAYFRSPGRPPARRVGFAPTVEPGGGSVVVFAEF